MPDHRLTSRSVSVRVPLHIYSILKARADFNRRSVSGELIYLTEVGLSAGNDQMKALVRLVGEVNAMPDENNVGS